MGAFLRVREIVILLVRNGILRTKQIKNPTNSKFPHIKLSLSFFFQSDSYSPIVILMENVTERNILFC